MATKLASTTGPNMAHHTAGIFADMTVDGPQIGTVVLVVDRAKNLPNRKTMGKQNPYCAARLGKEAKKTETDRRGGQTPKWDQELRFTVHDSPDYHTLKVSVFSEDKRTDLIGEAWVSLSDILVPGGGKRDLWQGLNCKGKYAGEIRLELTYYDTRPKQEKSWESVVAEEGLGAAPGSGSKVKRRPIPSGVRGMTPETIAGPGAVELPARAKHGPREYGSSPIQIHDQTPLRDQHGARQQHPDPRQYDDQRFVEPPHQVSLYQYDQTPSPQYHDSYEQYEERQEYNEHHPHATAPHPHFLPQLAPSSRQRALPRPESQYAGLAHSHSAPIVPTALHTDAPEPLPDLEYQYEQTSRRGSDAPPGWANPHEHRQVHHQPYIQDELPEPPPPPPPMHSNSAPAVPHYTAQHAHPRTPPRFDQSPPTAQEQYVPRVSPLQSVERTYGQAQQMPHAHPARGRSVDEYTPSPEHRSYENTPASLLPGQPPAPYARAPVARALPRHRHSVADPYGTTPPRPHPLSQEMPRACSPLLYQEDPFHDPAPQQYRRSYHEPAPSSHDAPPLMKPQAISPRPAEAAPPPQQAQPAPGPRSSYNIQFPVRSFESSDQSPLSTSRPNPVVARVVDRSCTARKSVSPRLSPPSGVGQTPPSIPYGPDSFDVHNPRSAGGSPLATRPSYQIRPDHDPALSGEKTPITGWDGREIDPSDHLPIESWAPEPEEKKPPKTYGLGRDRDFGPRSSAPSSTVAAAGPTRLSKDTVVSFRSAAKSSPSAYGPAPSLPPKVPLQPQPDYDAEALSREISSIDIGAGRGARHGLGHGHVYSGPAVPAPTPYVPVRSHRDRGSYY